MYKFFIRMKLFIQVVASVFNPMILLEMHYNILFDQVALIGPSCLLITGMTSFFISLVLNLQIVKEFLYLNATDLTASILAISFIRELSPVLTSIILIGKTCSFFTSEIATMSVTEQIDSLLVLGINPIRYLILPRVLAVLICLPILNLFSLLTSFISSAFICFVFYSIYPVFFFDSLFYGFFMIDIYKSMLKVLIFGLFISIISCVWGITTSGGSQGVGLSTTSSVITSLVLVFVLNFILSYVMFSTLGSSFEKL
uniref:ABC transporter permease n=1 Tax=Herposiphonia versicolor TaxID=2007163 RepID=A0A1Z1MFG0_9FLOR|nr:hypothetical protein [Herposiphonia versicolor]ARW64706.1 hypothetical protein [Herposiphonia versicolor]